MPDLAEGESTLVQGSAAKPYELRNTGGGVYTCSCPAWRNQGLPPERRTCKHLRRLRGEAAETARVAAAGGTPGAPPIRAPKLAKPATGGAEGGEGAAEEEEDEGAPVLLAERWDNVRDLAGWWLSEKLDGVRAYWDGKELYSRLGNAFHVPEWFKAGLPSTPLDGELWGGRKRFQETVSIVRRQDRGEQWRTVQFVVFDAPAMDAIFEARQAHLRRWHAGARLEHVRVLEQVACEGVEHLRSELARVEGIGGEGLMLREPGSRYVVGRSSTLLKVKSFFDAEARVLEHVAGAGRHKGRLGALLCEMPSGTRFNVGTGFSDAERAAPPAIGALITYRYQELSNKGVPRFPSFVAVRDDVRPAAAPAPAKKKEEEPMPEQKPGTRRYECTEDGASKFWEVSVAGASFTVRYGKIGTDGQSKTKACASPAAAAAEAAKLVAEKTKKGYEEVKSGARKGARASDDDEAEDRDDGDEE